MHKIKIIKTLIPLCFGLFAISWVARAADLSVNNATVDNTSVNNGTSNHWLNFGGTGSVEGIGSQRTSGAAQNGLDLYTFGTRRMHIGHNGGVNIGDTSDPGAGNLATGGAFLSGYNVSFKVATNEQVHFRTHLTAAAGPAIVAANDNDAALVPLEIRATPTLFAGGGVNIGGTSDPGAGGLILNPAASNQGLFVTGSFTGTTPPGNWAKNDIQITSDDGNFPAPSPSPAPFTSALNTYHKFGGSNKVSGVNSLQVQTELTSPTSSSNTNRDYVAGYFGSLATLGDGGTQWTPPYYLESKGSMFGLNAYVRGQGVGPYGTQTPATYLSQLVGMEIDVDLQNGSSTASRVGLIINDQGNGPGQGAMNDSAISVVRDGYNGYPNSTTTGWGSIINLGYDNGSGGGQPLATTGAVIRAAGTATIGSLIDLPDYTMTTALMRLNSANMSTGSHPTLVKWLKIVDNAGSAFYIPLYQ
jgi:hypothetical protein